MAKRQTYVEPGSYFTPEMLKIVENANKKKATTPTKPVKKPANTGKKK